jgi:hypothetical protein
MGENGGGEWMCECEDWCARCEGVFFVAEAGGNDCDLRPTLHSSFVNRARMTCSVHTCTWFLRARGVSFGGVR